MKKNLLVLLILFGLGLFAMRTFFQPGYFDGHDAQAHLVRLYQYDLALKDGQILPQWAGSLLAGRGYPVFIFAYPLPYLISEAFHLLGFGLAVAIKLTFVLAYLTSSLGMYFFALNLWQSRLAGFIAAILWSWAPPIFEKIFIAGTLGEVVAFAFIPFTFLALYKLINQPNVKHVIYLTLSLTAWVLSHLLNPFIFAPLLILFSLNQLFISKHKKIGFQLLLFSGFLTLGLTAWFIVPAALEIKFTHFNDFVKHNYANDFVSLSRLLYSKWGTDAPGWGNNPVSQQVGVAQWLVVGLALLFYCRRILPFLISFALSIFLMLSISKPIWDLPTPLQSISTPWRFLSLAVFSAAVSAGYLIHIIKKKNIKLFVFCLLIFLALYGNRNHLRINDIRNYDLNFLQTYTGVATGWNEHLPIWVKDMPDQFTSSKLEILAGACEVKENIIKSNRQEFSLQCHQASTLQLNTAYYPGWQIKVDRQNITALVIDNLDLSNGMMRFNLPAGQHQLQARFTDTPLRLFAKIISVLTFAGLIIFYNKSRFFSLLPRRLLGLFHSCAGKKAKTLSDRRSIQP